MSASPASPTIVKKAFLITLIAKGVLGIVQLLIAAVIALGFVAQLPALAKAFFRDELVENPTDFLAGLILDMVGLLPSVDLTFYQTYFAAHGLLHMVIVGSLLAGAAWAYPMTIVMLIAFVAYQVAEWMSVGGVMLVVLTGIDLFVLLLTWLEWSARRHPTMQ